MKNFTLATVNTVNEKCVHWSRAIKNFSESINLSPWPSRNWSTTHVFVRVSVVMHLNKTLIENSYIRFITNSFRVITGG